MREMLLRRLQPNWAFTDPMATGGTFNATAAMQMKSAAGLGMHILLTVDCMSETIIPVVPDTVFNVKSETSSTPSATGSSGSSSSNDSKINKGAIAGGTMGGLACGLLLGALAVKLLMGKKQKKSRDQSSIHSDATEDTIRREKASMQQV